MQGQHRFEILEITYINGERSNIDYPYKKTKFDSFEEMEKYKIYLQKLVSKDIYLKYIDLKK